MAMTHDDEGGAAQSPAGRRGPTRRYEARRNAIVSSAVEEMNRKGVRGMTLGDVAARLDLVPTGVIYYFRNKEELAAAAFLKGIQSYEALIASAAGAPTAEARLAAYLVAWFDYSRRVQMGEADRLPVFNDVRALNSPVVNEAYVGMFRQYRALLPPDLPRPHANARAHMLLSQMFWIPAWSHQVEIDDYARTAERMARILSRGVAAPGVNWPAPRRLELAAAGEPAAASESFLRAATCLINERSYRGASVERIAAHLNVTKGSFYHHIDSKDDLVEACFRRSFEIMTQSQFAVSGTADTAWASISGSVTDLLYRQFDDEAALLRSSALQALPPAVRAKVVAWSNRVARRYAGLLADGMADGSVRPVDPLIAAQTIMALVNSAYDLRWWAQRLTIDAAVASYGSNLAFGLVGKTS